MGPRLPSAKPESEEPAAGFQLGLELTSQLDPSQLGLVLTSQLGLELTSHGIRARWSSGANWIDWMIPRDWSPRASPPKLLEETPVDQEAAVDQQEEAAVNQQEAVDQQEEEERHPRTGG